MSSRSDLWLEPGRQPRDTASLPGGEAVRSAPRRLALRPCRRPLSDALWQDCASASVRPRGWGEG